MVVAFSRSVASASMVREPPAVTSESMIEASAFDGVSPPRAELISGSAIVDSTRLNSTLDDCQPSELKAIITPRAASPVLVEAATVASRIAALSASTFTLPAVASISASRTVARAEEFTTLVAIVPLIATDLPSPQIDPPEEVTSDVRLASMVALALAVTSRLPVLVAAVIPRISASALEST